MKEVKITLLITPRSKVKNSLCSRSHLKCLEQTAETAPVLSAQPEERKGCGTSRYSYVTVSAGSSRARSVASRQNQGRLPHPTTSGRSPAPQRGRFPSRGVAATTSLLGSSRGQVAEHPQLLQEILSSRSRDRERFRIAAAYWLVVAFFKKLKPGGTGPLTLSEPPFRFPANELFLATVQKPFFEHAERRVIGQGSSGAAGLTWCGARRPGRLLG